MLEEPRGGTIRVVLADDHELVRRGLRMVLDAEDDIAVVAEAADCDEAVRRTLEERPDVLLLDLRMPGSGAADVCRRVIDQGGGTRVMVLSTFDDDADVYAVMEAGASGYLLKSVAPDALARSIRGVADGSVVMDPDVAHRLMRLRREPGCPDSPDALSGRELEVLALMARGMKNREIAREMWISESTVKTHVGRVIRKLGQRDRTQAVLRAIQAGLVSVDPS
ncbi:MAG TPA: response regulator transcription factor [Coriobacteriia bacterium]